jgi:hypothetical protein
MRSRCEGKSHAPGRGSRRSPRSRRPVGVVLWTRSGDQLLAVGSECVAGISDWRRLARASSQPKRKVTRKKISPSTPRISAELAIAEISRAVTRPESRSISLRRRSFRVALMAGSTSSTATKAKMPIQAATVATRPAANEATAISQPTTRSGKPGSCRASRSRAAIAKWSLMGIGMADGRAASRKSAALDERSAALGDLLSHSANKSPTLRISACSRTQGVSGRGRTWLCELRREAASSPA